nr:hypothetical protein [Tanacetum cinerariifolium]
DQPPVTESSSSHDTTQDSRDSLEGTNRSEGDHVQSPHDSPLSGDHTSDRGKGALNLEELFSICTNLSNRVLALETVKDPQAVEIIALKARIKKLKKKCKPSISHHRAWLKSVQRLSIKKRFEKKESVSKQGRKKDKPEPTLDDSTLDDLNVDHGVDTEEPMNQGRLSKETEEQVSTARQGDSTIRPDFGTADRIVPLTTTTSIFDDKDITMAQTLIKMKEEKAKEKGVSIKDIKDSSRPSRSILTLKPLPTIDLKDKGKGVLEEPEPAKKMTRSNLDAAQIAKDAKVARLVYKEELAELERENEKKTEGRRSLYERQKKVIDDFKPMDSDDAVDKEKVLEEPDSTKIVLDKEGEVDYEVLDKRFPIINWESKFYHLDRHGAECIYYRIFGSDRSSRWIKTYSKMVTRFDRMDLEDLYNLVMQRFETTSLEGIDLVLWGDLRTMFEETTDDDLWKNQEEWILKSWNFYANCEVHTLTFKDGTEIYMLVERRYPLTKETLKRMLALRLIAESESKAVFYLLRFI